MGNLVSKYSDDLNVLHTYSEYFQPHLENLFTVKDSQDSLADLSVQIQLLQANELAFYRTIFPGLSFPKNGAEAFKMFLLKIKELVPIEDKEVFNRFNNFNNSDARNVFDSAFGYLQVPDSNSQVYQTMFGTDTVPLASWITGQEDTSAIAFRKNLLLNTRELNQPITFVLTKHSEVSKTAEKYLTDLGYQGDFSTVIENAFSQNLPKIINGADFSQIIEKQNQILKERRKEKIQRLAEAWVKENYKTKYKKPTKVLEDEKKKIQEVSKALDEALTKPSPVTLMYTFKEQIEKHLIKYGYTGSKEEFEQYMKWTFSKKFQSKLEYSFGEKGKLDSSNIQDIELAKNNLTAIINSLCAGGSPDLQSAKEKTLRDLIDAKDFSVSFTYTNIPGLLGEFAGAMLFNLLTSNGINAQVAGQERNDWSEQIKGDIQFNLLEIGSDFYGGVQVKNWQQKSLEKFGLGVKLHPSHFLSQIIKASGEQNGVGIEMLKTTLANFAFNADTLSAEKEETEMTLESLLKNYFAFVLNLYGGENLDTSPFWLIGSGTIVPGSMIVEAFQEAIKEQQTKSYSLKISTSKKEKNNEYYASLVQKGDKTSARFLEYWQPTISGEDWIYRKEGDNTEINNLVNSDIISIQTHFDIIRTLQYMVGKIDQKASPLQYDLLNVFK